MVTGNGPSHLNEFMATLNSPGLSQPSFSAIETDIGKWWQDVLLADILAAGQEERRLAIERKDYHEEVPAITVITDGKRFDPGTFGLLSKLNLCEHP
jgi:hypothetical protein